MAVKRFLLVVVLEIGILFGVESCKDMGSEVPPPPPTPVTVGQNSFFLVPGQSAATLLSGGIRPYSFVSEGNTSVVNPSFADDSLRLQALGLGTSTIVIGDNSSPQQTTTVSVTVVALAAGQNTFNLFVGDIDSTTISGGTQPYSFITTGDTTKVIPSLTGSVVVIRAVAAGSSAIVVGDNSGTQLSVTISVTVSAPVSFSTQVQPIFTNRCVNAGCHPGGGAPFPLQASVSYGNLVGVTATNGPCAGDKRVLPFSADASALVKRLEGTCGFQMPLGGTPLPADQIQLIRDWINQGAANN